MTTCPSGVHYMHLVDHARAHIEKTYQRPVMDRVLREVLAFVLPYPGRFRASLFGALYGKLAMPALKLIPGIGKRMAAMLSLAPTKVSPPASFAGPGVFSPAGARRGRVAMLSGCAQPVLRPGTNDAAIRLLTRLGVEVVLPKGEGCCGALVHHMGKEDASHAQAKKNIDAWWSETTEGGGAGLDAIIITASGCGTTVKDYGHMFKHDAAYAEKAARVSALTKDVTEYLATLDLPAPSNPRPLTVAYHSACSMQHGQKITDLPKNLLQAAGFKVKSPLEGHLCCGSAGVYNIMQPEIATRLRDRKVANLERLKPDVIAAGNIGCITQIAQGTGIPLVHTVELLDWVHGGPMPEALAETALAKPA
jgi:glycolate oxidase iron-sulfur subunit